MPIFLFPDDNLSKFKGILDKFGTCIDIKEIWFRMANGQISSIFDSYLSRHDNGRVLSFFILLTRATIFVSSWLLSYAPILFGKRGPL